MADSLPGPSRRGRLPGSTLRAPKSGQVAQSSSSTSVQRRPASVPSSTATRSGRRTCPQRDGPCECKPREEGGGQQLPPSASGASGSSRTALGDGAPASSLPQSHKKLSRRQAQRAASKTPAAPAPPSGPPAAVNPAALATPTALAALGAPSSSTSIGMRSVRPVRSRTGIPTQQRAAGAKGSVTQCPVACTTALARLGARAGAKAGAEAVAMAVQRAVASTSAHATPSCPGITAGGAATHGGTRHAAPQGPESPTMARLRDLAMLSNADDFLMAEGVCIGASGAQARTPVAPCSPTMQRLRQRGACPATLTMPQKAPWQDDPILRAEMEDIALMEPGEGTPVTRRFRERARAVPSFGVAPLSEQGSSGTGLRGPLRAPARRMQQPVSSRGPVASRSRGRGRGGRMVPRRLEPELEAVAPWEEDPALERELHVVGAEAAAASRRPLSPTRERIKRMGTQGTQFLESEIPPWDPSQSFELDETYPTSTSRNQAFSPHRPCPGATATQRAGRAGGVMDPNYSMYKTIAENLRRQEEHEFRTLNQSLREMQEWRRELISDFQLSSMMGQIGEGEMLESVQAPDEYEEVFDVEDFASSPTGGRDAQMLPSTPRRNPMDEPDLIQFSPPLVDLSTPDDPCTNTCSAVGYYSRQLLEEMQNI